MVSKKDYENVLNLELIRSGGDDPFKEVEIPSIKIDGKPGIILLKSPPAAVVLAYTNLSADKQAQGLLPLIAQCAVNPDNSLIWDPSDTKSLAEIPMTVFTKLAKEVVAYCGIDDDETPSPGPTRVDTVESSGNE